MKIVIDARTIGTSTGRYADRLIAHLAGLDSTNQYVVLLSAGAFKTWQPPASNFQKQLADFNPYTFGEQLGFVWQLYQLRADLVHFTMPNYPLLYFKRFVLTLHDLTLLSFPSEAGGSPMARLYKRVFKPLAFRLDLFWASLFAKQIIVPTNYVATELKRRFGLTKSRVNVTYEAAEPINAPPAAIPKLLQKRFILYVGNGLAHKNLERLVAAFKIIRDQDISLNLVLVGSFYSGLKRFVKNQDIKGVTFLSYAKDGELVWLYQHALVFALPSLSEGFGLTGLEAMRYKLPVAASKATCLPEVYGPATLYFNPLDTIDMADKIKRLLENQSVRGRLIKAGKKQVGGYSWDKTAKETLVVYNKALGKS